MSSIEQTAILGRTGLNKIIYEYHYQQVPTDGLMYSGSLYNHWTSHQDSWKRPASFTSPEAQCLHSVC